MKKFILFCLAILLSLPAFSQRDETALHNPGIKLTGFWGGGISRMHNFNSDHNYAHGSYFAFDEKGSKNLDWFYHLTGGVTHTDFFATRPTDYSKAGEGEDFEDIW